MNLQAKQRDKHAELKKQLDELQEKITSEKALKEHQEQIQRLAEHAKQAEDHFKARETYLQRLADAADLKTQLAQAQLAQAEARARESELVQKEQAKQFKLYQAEQDKLMTKVKAQLTATSALQDTLQGSSELNKLLQEKNSMLETRLKEATAANAKFKARLDTSERNLINASLSHQENKTHLESQRGKLEMLCRQLQTERNEARDKLRASSINGGGGSGAGADAGAAGSCAVSGAGVDVTQLAVSPNGSKKEGASEGSQ